VLFKLNRLQYEFWSFCGGVAEDSVLLGYDAASFWATYCLPFQVLLSPRFVYDLMKMKALCSFKTLCWDTASYSRRTESSRLQYFFFFILESSKQKWTPDYDRCTWSPYCTVGLNESVKLNRTLLSYFCCCDMWSLCERLLNFKCFANYTVRKLLAVWGMKFQDVWCCIVRNTLKYTGNLVLLW
jgi:hypothetical protein